jgi:GNAT superfamily N-acetyltransferase
MIHHQNLKMPKSPTLDIHVRPLREPDLPEARRIFHLAFGTFLGLPDPLQFCPDRDFVTARWQADSAGAFAAEAGGELLGSSLLANWGSVAVFGPLTIRPEFWDKGVARRLLEATVELFPKWGIKHAGLFTFAHSTKHVHLYQKFGFWPRFLTAIMSKPVQPRESIQGVVTFSELAESRKAECLKACRELTNAIHDGLDLERELRSLEAQKLGDSVLLFDNSRLAAFAICHCGAGTEAGDGNSYVKFGVARNAESFEGLLDACEAFALRRGLSRLEAGMNLARDDAYRRMLARGFHTDVLGVAMHNPNEPGYNRPDVYIIDDWR